MDRSQTDEEQFEDAMEEAMRIDATHSWLYGTFNVRCTMCGVSKGDMKSLNPCPGPVSHGCF